MKVKGALLALFVFSALAAGAAYSAAEPPKFFKTTDSDEWVENTFDIQRQYPRVLVVTAGEAPPQVTVVSLHLSGMTLAGEAEARIPDAVFKTLQQAADAAKGGDLVAVMPGTYAGFHIGDKPDAGDGAYIHFRAMGAPGAVTIDRPAEGKDSNWMILLQPAHHVIVEGFNIAGKTGPGLEAIGARAGIFIDGDFRNTSKTAHHIVILDNFSHNHRSWGLHSTDSHTVLMQGNLFALSCQEHSAYVSDGSDNYVVRRNVFHASRSSGLQCNLDPLASLGELAAHPKMASVGEDDGSWKWAKGLLDKATAEFGENNFPDGKGINFIIENNVIWGNGRGGGGSLNLAALQDSLIQNNLIYGNYTTGIAMWDNANPYDETRVDPGPSAPADIKGPESLPYWGCQRNVVRNNTVLMDVATRPGMVMTHGSWGNVLRNNIIVNDSGISLEVSNSSIYKLDSGYNVLGRTEYENVPDALRAVAVALDETNHSVLGARMKALSGELVNLQMEPPVIIEGGWWKMNPARGDFHPNAGSKLLAGAGESGQLAQRDIEGDRRSAADIGAFSAAAKGAE